MKVKDLNTEIIAEEYLEAIKLLKKEAINAPVINDFLNSVNSQNEFKLENLKLLARKNFVACLTVLTYTQLEFYKEKKMYPEYIIESN